MSFAPFERIPGQTGSRTILICDHASNAVPSEIHGGSLGLPSEDMERHIAYDVGARGVTLKLAELLGAAAVLSTFSRLVIDPNRDADDPTLVRRIYDGSVIEGNRGADAAEVARRKDAYYHPYHRQIDREIDSVAATGAVPIVISIHSFTPRLKGQQQRPWHIGVLWDGIDGRLAQPLIASLRSEPDLCIGDNEPYWGKFQGDCVDQHAIAHGLPYVLIELRNDLIASEADQIAWADRLAPHLAALLDLGESQQRLVPA
ncbi:MAG: N-formylglutamate amidohydrolase [Pseudomonadota bacterium]